MALYRALSNLDAGKKRLQQGQVFYSSILPAPVLQKLAELGKVAIVSTPPLDVLPGWKIRAHYLMPEIETAAQFLECNAEQLQKKLSIDGAEVERLKAELISWLTIPAPEG